MSSLSSRPSFLRAFSIASALTLALLAAGLTAATVVRAAAQTLTVNTTADGDQGPGSTCASPAAGGACTLRAAIDLADQGSGDTITVPAGTYALDHNLGVLNVTASMTISGAGPSTTIVDGGNATDVLSVISQAALISVAISGMTVRDGFDASEFAAGANIRNEAALTLTNDVVSGGRAPSGIGGGIASEGNLTLDGVVVTGNEAGDAGGLAMIEGVLTTIKRSTFSDNVADGALVRDRDGNLFHLAGRGGGILLFGGEVPPTIVITGSAITGNSASGLVTTDPLDFPEGGGIFNFAGNLLLANDTLTGNTATRSSGANRPAVGGGIAQTDASSPTPVSAARINTPRQPLSVLVRQFRSAVDTAPATGAEASLGASAKLDFVTLSGNSADEFGGISTLVGTFDVTNSILAFNTGGNCGNPKRVTSGGYNLENAEDCDFRQVGDQSNASPRLDTLKLNAPGSTATMALLPGSPAIDAADPHCDQSTDQRGVTRPQGSRCDIGAFEVEQATPVTPVPSPPVTGLVATASVHRGLAAAGALALLVLLAALGAAAAVRLSGSIRV